MRYQHLLIAICVFVTITCSLQLNAQVIDYRQASATSEPMSFRRLGFRGDIDTARMAEKFAGYIPPPGGETSAYWHAEYGGRLKGGFAYRNASIAVAHTNQLRIWDLQSGKEVRRFPLQNQFPVGLLRFNGNPAVVCLQQPWFRARNLRNEIQFWDLSTGELVERIPNGEKYTVSLSSTDRGQLARELQVKQSAVVNSLYLAGLSNELGFPKQNLSVLNASAVIKTQASADMRWLASSHKNGEVLLWDLHSRREVRRWQLQNKASNLCFSSDGEKLIVSSFSDRNSPYHSIVLDCSSGDTLLASPLEQCYFVPGTQLIAGRSRYENDVQLCDASTGEPLAALVLFSAERHWAIKTNQGYFNCSAETLDFLKANADTLAVERDVDFIEKYHRPEVVRHVLAGIPHDLALQMPAGYEPPTSQIRLISTSQQAVKVAISASGSSDEVTITKVELTRKHLPLSSDTLAQLKESNGEEKIIELPFPPGKNRMTLSCLAIDSFGVKSKLAELSIERPEHVEELSGRLFVLAVGVSNHKYSEYDLVYPAIDAKAIAEQLKRQEGLAFGEVRVQIYPDERATLKNVRNGLAWLQRVVTPDDVAVVFFAGHGLRGRRGLYYVTHEGDAEGIQYTCLNWEEIAQTLDKIKAKQTLFLSDVCHAGVFAESDVPLQSELSASMKEIEGVLVYAASGPEELAYEDPKWQHGAFTSAVLSSLSGKADKDRDGAVSLLELITHTTARTRQLTEGQQTPFVGSTANYDENLILARVLKRDGETEATERVALPEDASQ